MASENLRIDMDSCERFKTYVEQQGNNIRTISNEYKKQINYFKNYALKSGKTADAFKEYVASAENILSQIEEMSDSIVAKNNGFVGHINELENATTFKDMGE